MKPTWLVIANSVEAKFFNVLNHQNYEVVKTLTHESSRLKNQDLVSDRPGHYQSSHSAHGQFMPHSDMHTLEHEHFAAEIGKFLEHAHSQHLFESLIVCAEPRFLGELRNAFSEGLKRLLHKEVHKDYVPLDAQKLKAVIAELIG